MPFNNITNLRGKGDTYTITPDQLIEIQKCYDNPIYFIETYVYLKLTPFDDPIRFSLEDYQEGTITAFNKHRFNIINDSKSTGIPTTTLAYILWYSLFNCDRNIVMLDKRLNLAQESLNKFKEIYMSLPMWMQPGVTCWKKRSVKLCNGTHIRIGATVTDTVKGLSINLLYINNFAESKSQYAEPFIDWVFPILMSNDTSQIIISSSPSGCNHFKKLWDNGRYEGQYINSKYCNAFIKHLIPYTAMESRDETWRELITKQIGEIRFKQEYMCEFIGGET